ncbi:MAG: type I-E CRISPR-associated protein Cse1/CasA [Rhodobacteraceae bacterium PARR1]|nr:MAG: type I-E CRISPR-associated protein Cse1/CasA [Rhodobacteraceae bacterium PARR1]
MEDVCLSLNLIDDPWIPVILKDGSRKVIAPWQMTDSDVIRPDCPRADLNLACLELLIGLVYLADPPEHVEDWDDRRKPDPARLRDRLAAYAPAFNLLGEGPLFLQDLEPLEGEANPADMLFIDSAGANTARNNADLMVHRDRYSTVDPAFAAMALYTFQAHAPAGGAGNRTSLRGGGPLVTLVDPGRGLWDLVWANVPDGSSGQMADLPWMRATRVSDKGAVTHPPEGRTFGVEAFFGMPRRLRLVADGAVVKGVIQRPYGTNYSGWVHPLTPYYRMKAGEELLPVHPRAGLFGYRHWLGILAGSADGLKDCASCLTTWQSRDRRAAVTVLVAGWAMDNMKARDFTLSSQPYVDLPPHAAAMLQGMILAAEQAALALRGALEPVLAGGEAREAEREALYLRTEGDFLSCFDALKSGAAPTEVAVQWLGHLQRHAFKQFDDLALQGLDQCETDQIARVVQSRGYLAATFRGYGKTGGELFTRLGMEKPAKKGKAA